MRLARRREAGFPTQGSIVVGTEGTLLIPHHSTPSLYPWNKYKDTRLPRIKSNHHWWQWIDACLGRGETSTHFDYAGPLTEAVLLGSVAVRFPGETLEWDGPGLQFTNRPEANTYVRRAPRAGWEMEGLA
jgi:hypothetical protein